MLQSASQGGVCLVRGDVCLVQGGVCSGGCLPGLGGGVLPGRGVLLGRGGSPWSREGGLPGRGDSPWQGGSSFSGGVLPTGDPPCEQNDRQV